MLGDPLFHPLDFVEAFVAEFFAVNLLLNAARLMTANLGLPGGGKYRINVVMKTARLERLPFVLVEPHAAAVATLIDREIGAVADSVFDQNLVAFRTEFPDQCAGRGIGRKSLPGGRLRQVSFVLIAPFPVFKRRNPITVAFTAMARSKIVLE